MRKQKWTREQRAKRVKWQKTCFIFTVNLGHTEIPADASEDEQIEQLEQHWADLLALPNVKLARGQIERNENGVLHINGGVKFSGVTRAQTLMNRWGCWADPADNEQAVLAYGKKAETRVQPLANFGSKKAPKTLGDSPKTIAIDLLKAGWTPAQICAVHTDIYFTHHRAINETFKMMLMGSGVVLEEEE